MNLKSAVQTTAKREGVTSSQFRPLKGVNEKVVESRSTTGTLFLLKP